MAEQQAGSTQTIGGRRRGRRRVFVAAAALLVLAGVLVAILLPGNRPSGSSPAARAGAQARAAGGATGSGTGAATGSGTGAATGSGTAGAAKSGAGGATGRGAGAAGGGRARSGATGSVAPGTAAIAAQYLGLTRAQIRNEMRSGHTLAAIAAATQGKSAAGLIDVIVRERTAALRRRGLSAGRLRARLQHLRPAVTASVNRLPLHARVSARVLSLAAAYLGISRVRLGEEVESGRTLAAVARGTPGHSQAGLVAALLAAERTRLQRLAAAGVTDRTKTSKALAALPRRIEAAVRR